MFGPSSGMGYRVPPLKIANIRTHALAVRGKLVASNDAFFGMEHFIESLINYGITCDVVDEDELPFGIEACCVPERLLITFSNTTYEKACNDDPRARFTVIHELGHILLAHTRTFNRDRGGKIEAYEDSEWQADQFAAEFLMPLTHIVANGFKTADELILNYQVSAPAAERRIAQLNKRNELPQNR
jgi:hypothetical protein